MSPKPFVMSHSHCGCTLLPLCTATVLALHMNYFWQHCLDISYLAHCSWKEKVVWKSTIEVCSWSLGVLSFARNGKATVVSIYRLPSNYSQWKWANFSMLCLSLVTRLKTRHRDRLAVARNHEFEIEKGPPRSKQIVTRGDNLLFFCGFGRGWQKWQALFFAPPPSCHCR